MLALLAVVALAVLVAPILVVIPLAFSSAPFLMFPPPGVSLRWFAAYFSDPEWIGSTWFSLWVAALSATGATAIGVLSAYALVRLRPRGGAAIYLLWASPLVLPHLVIAVSLYYLLASLRLIGNPFTFVAAYAVLGLPYALVMLTATLQKLDPALEQAAATLGAAPVAVWRTVVLPLILPAVVSSFTFAFLVGFDDLAVSLFLAAPGAYPLPLRMWDDIRQEINPRIAAVAVVFFAVALTTFALLAIARALWRRAPTGISPARRSELDHESRGFAPSEFAARIARLRDVMRARGAAAMLIDENESLAYYTGYETSLSFWRAHRPLDGPPAMVLRRLDAAPFLERAWFTDHHGFADTDDAVELVAAMLHARGLGRRRDRARLRQPRHVRRHLPPPPDGVAGRALHRHDGRARGAAADQARRPRSRASPRRVDR